MRALNLNFETGQLWDLTLTNKWRGFLQLFWVHRLADDLAPPTILSMPKRTSPSDASKITEASDLEDLVVDKRSSWRATSAKGRRRQRRYQNLLTHQMVKQLEFSDEDDFDTL